MYTNSNNNNGILLHNLFTNIKQKVKNCKAIHQKQDQLNLLSSGGLKTFEYWPKHGDSMQLGLQVVITYSTCDLNM